MTILEQALQAQFKEAGYICRKIEGLSGNHYVISHYKKLSGKTLLHLACDGTALRYNTSSYKVISVNLNDPDLIAKIATAAHAEYLNKLGFNSISKPPVYRYRKRNGKHT